MRQSLLVGMVVFLKPEGNQLRRSKEIRKGVIKKIGKKYFDVAFLDENGKERMYTEQFVIETMRVNTQYCSDWTVYLDEQELLDEIEIKALHTDIRMTFYDTYMPKYTLDQYRRIKAIMEE